MLFPVLDERQKRLMAAADALIIGRGGISVVAAASGMSRVTIHRGIREIEAGQVTEKRIRRLGAGRKPVTFHDPRVLRDLESLVDPLAKGDPQSPLRWTCKSTRQLADALGALGHQLSYKTVGALLHDLGYSLQANTKSLEGADHPDRDRQFRYINERVEFFLRRRHPVISVDTKKKELVGRYKNGGQEWRPQGEPEQVKTHDFIDKELGKAIPYGVYDLQHDLGWVNVGCDHDTAEFALESIRCWWKTLGRRLYSSSGKLLICADAGGSNGYRLRLWKVEVQKFATETGLAITVCHFPPGTSKWNKVEHRLFSFISMNWRGRPLISHEVMVKLIGSTTTRSGLKVRARLDRRQYETEIKVSDEEMEELNLHPHDFHGEWNYTIKPT